jgi:hypothetical protein
MKELAWGLGMGLQTVPEGMPVLDAYRNALLRCGRKSARVDTGESKMKILSDFSFPVNRDAVLEWLLDEHGIDEQMVLEAEQLLNSVNQLPCVIVHPVFDLLAQGC